MPSTEAAKVCPASTNNELNGGRRFVHSLMDARNLVKQRHAHCGGGCCPPSRNFRELAAGSVASSVAFGRPQVSGCRAAHGALATEGPVVLPARGGSCRVRRSPDPVPPAVPERVDLVEGVQPVPARNPAQVAELMEHPLGKTALVGPRRRYLGVHSGSAGYGASPGGARLPAGTTRRRSGACAALSGCAACCPVSPAAASRALSLQLRRRISRTATATAPGWWRSFRRIARRGEPSSCRRNPGTQAAERTGWRNP